MLDDFKKAYESELLTYISEFENEQSWLRADFTKYQEAVEELCDRYSSVSELTPLISGMFKRRQYFELFRTPSIENLKLYLKGDN